MKSIILRSVTCVVFASALVACSPRSAADAPAGAVYPTDAQVSAALQTQFQTDPHSAAARDLIRTLGGDKGALRYQIHKVIYRQGAYEARYDALLVMGQPGAQSLQALYASMIPETERSRLGEASLDAYEKWLKGQAQALQKTSPPQAQALKDTLELLGKCYRDAKAGSEVMVMQGLGALISPERSGLFAEKLALPDTRAHCLPA